MGEEEEWAEQVTYILLSQKNATCINYMACIASFHLEIWHLASAGRVISAFAYILACAEPQYYSAEHSTMLKCNKAWAYA